MKPEIERALQFGDIHQMPCWKVYYGTHNARAQVVAGTSESALSTTPAAAIDWKTSRGALDSLLQILPDGPYTIHFKPTPEEKLKFFVFTMTITNSGSAAIAGVQQQQGLQNQQLPLTLIMGNYMQLMEANIGKLNAENNARIREKELLWEMEKLKEKNKEKKNSSFDIKELPQIIRESANTFFEIRAMKNGTGERPQIAISGANEKNIPADAATKKEPPAELEIEEKYIELQNETMVDLAELFGSYENAITELHCLKEFLKENTGMYNSMIVPQLKKYKDVLISRGFAAGK